MKDSWTNFGENYPDSISKLQNEGCVQTAGESHLNQIHCLTGQHDWPILCSPVLCVTSDYCNTFIV